MNRNPPSTCSFCRSYIYNNNLLCGAAASNPTCQECLNKMNSVPSGFPFKLVSKFPEYECPICLSLIRKATELPCTHFMCHTCLEYYENGRLRTHGNDATFLCSICQIAYEREKKKEVGSLDRIIQTTLTVQCLQEECDWTGCIKDYDDHKKVCKYVLINCVNEECKVKVQRQFIDNHVSRCMTQCEYCQQHVVFTSLQPHQKKCSNFPVTCPNRDCFSLIKRSEISLHCENECEFEPISCPYFELGCFFQGVRGKMHLHKETYKLKHDILILKAVTSLKEKSNLGKDEEKDVEIEQLRTLNAKKDVELKVLKELNAKKDFELKDLDELNAKKDFELKSLNDLNAKRDVESEEMKNEIKKLKTQFTQLETKVKRNEEKTQDCFEQTNEKQKKYSEKVDQLSKDGIDFQKFAEQISELTYNLGCELFARNRNYHLHTIFQKRYEEDKDAKRWKNMVEGVNKESKLKYFVYLRDSIHKYQEVIYNPTYEKRLYLLTKRLPFGLNHGNVDIGFFTRIHCYPLTKSICVSWGNSLNEFKKKVDEHHYSYPKVQNVHGACYFYDDEDCLHVVKTGHRDNNYHLLHKSNEDEHLKLSNGTKVNIDCSRHRINGSFVLWAKKVFTGF